MQKISQKMDNLKKKNSNITKKSFVETAHNFNVAFAFASQKTNKLKQMLNIKMMMMRINSDVDKKIFIKKSTQNLINQIAVRLSQLSKHNEND